MLRTVYHKKDGGKEMYDIDASAAVRNFPDEWSDKPWGAKPASKKEAKDTPQPPVDNEHVADGAEPFDVSTVEKKLDNKS